MSVYSLSRVRNNAFISVVQPCVFDFMPTALFIHTDPRLCRCTYNTYMQLLGKLAGISGGGKGAEERVGTSRAGTINTCHASHMHTRAHLSFHTRADPRGAHASDRVCRARGKARQSIYLKADPRRQSPCRTIKDGGGNVTFPYAFLGGDSAFATGRLRISRLVLESRCDTAHFNRSTRVEARKFAVPDTTNK